MGMSKNLCQIIWDLCSSFIKHVVTFMMMSIYVDLFGVCFVYCLLRWFISATWKAANNTFTEKQTMKGRSSRPHVFYKIGVLKKFSKFTGKHLCQGPLFNKVAGLRLLPEAWNFIKKEILAHVFSYEFYAKLLTIFTGKKYALLNSV